MHCCRCIHQHIIIASDGAIYTTILILLVRKNEVQWNPSIVPPPPSKQGPTPEYRPNNNCTFLPLSSGHPSTVATKALQKWWPLLRSFTVQRWPTHWTLHLVPYYTTNIKIVTNRWHTNFKSIVKVKLHIYVRVPTSFRT